MNTTHLTDKDLITRILSGHPDLFGPLVERHIRAAHAIAYARLGNVADAEDAVQESFLRAYEKLGTLRDPARFAAWLLTIARHEAARIATKRNRLFTRDATGHSPLVTIDFETDSSTEVATVFHDPGQHEMNAILRDHVMRLPEASREILLLHYFAGHSARDIAALLDLRRAAVLKRLQRAREQLAETMLRDLQAVRPAQSHLAKQAARIGALAAGISIEKSVAAASIAATAATTGLTSLAWVSSLVPKAALIGAAAVGVIFSATTGWIYLSDRQTPPVEASANSVLSKVGDADTAQASTKVERSGAPAPSAGSFSEPPRAPIVPAEASAPADVSPTAKFRTATGRWEVTLYVAGAPERHPGEISLTDLGAVIKIVPENPAMQDFYHECRRHGDIIRLKVDAGEAAGTLTGKFNKSFTVLNLDGNIKWLSKETGEDDLVGTQLVATRIIVTPSRLEQIALLRKDIEALDEQLSAYIARTGKYPPRLDDLSPTYIADLTPYRSTATRTFDYTAPVIPNKALIESLTQSAFTARSAAELGNIEEKLIALWGDQFITTPTVLDVTDSELKAHLRLGSIDGIRGSIDEIADVPADTSTGPNPATIKTQNASCMNNMQRLASVFESFQAKQAHGLSPAGWRMTWPNIRPFANTLTCPSKEPGTESYEILFPGATREWLLRLGYTVGYLPDDAPESKLAAVVPIVMETADCAYSGKRNVLFLDGHVACLNAGERVFAVDPYLAYR